MNWKKPATFLCGALCMLLVTQFAVPALAKVAQKTIDVTTGVNFYVNDVKVNPTDVNGNPVDVFLYNGTTYLPVRALSNSLGQNITWDSKTSSVFFGTHDAGNLPAATLPTMDYFTNQRVRHISRVPMKDNLGNTHDALAVESWSGDSSITYKLNGKYTSLTGVFFLRYDWRSTTNHYSMTLYGDGRQLWTGVMTQGVEPQKFNVNLSDIQELLIQFNSPEAATPAYYIGDTTFYS